MRKLASFKGDDAFRVVNELLPYAFEVVGNEEVSALKKKGCTMLDYVRCAMEKEPKAMKGILAVLNNDPDYSPNAADLAFDMLDLICDKELMELFGLQSRKKGTSSGSASQSGKAGGKSTRSSTSSAHDSDEK